MTRILLALLVLCAFPAIAFAQGAAEIRFFPNVDEAGWAGERRDINLELWTEDLSFSGQSWVLPDVPGAFLMQSDSSSIKLSETRHGSAWQGLRYSLALFPQRDGTIEIPSFEVRFSTREGYMSTPVEHRFDTSPLTVEARLPDGAEPGAPLVSTTRFQLQTDWEPAPVEGMVELKTGDALVLTVKQLAWDVPGMVLAPLPEWQFDGLGIYADTPEVRDRAERGSLNGERVDRITFVCERPGSYRLPELRFQWWDSGAQKIHHEVLAAVNLEVVENPAWAVQGPSDSGDDQRAFDWRFARVLFVIVLVSWPLLWLTRRMWSWLKAELSARRLEPLNPR